MSLMSFDRLLCLGRDARQQWWAALPITARGVQNGNHSVRSKFARLGRQGQIVLSWIGREGGKTQKDSRLGTTDFLSCSRRRRAALSLTASLSSFNVLSTTAVMQESMIGN